MPDLRLGIVGSASSGKSALVHRYLTGSYMQEESPEGGRFKKEISIDGQSYLLLIRDEGGSPELQVSVSSNSLPLRWVATPPCRGHDPPMGSRAPQTSNESHRPVSGSRSIWGSRPTHEVTTHQRGHDPLKRATNRIDPSRDREPNGVTTHPWGHEPPMGSRPTEGERIRIDPSPDHDPFGGHDPPMGSRPTKKLRLNFVCFFCLLDRGPFFSLNGR